MMSPSHTTSSAEPFNKALPWILFITMMFFLNQTSRMLLSPILVPLEREFTLTHTATGSLLLFTSMGNAFSIFSSGFISSRIKHRHVIALSVGCYGMALTILSHAGSLQELRLGFTLCGLSGGLYFPSGMAALSSVVDRRHWGKTISVHELAPNLAFIAAPFLAEAIMQFTDWRGTLQCMGAVALTGAALFLAAGRGGQFCGEPPGRHSVPALLRRRETWMFVALIGVAVAIEWAPYSIMPLFLVNGEGMDRTAANTMIAMTRLPTPFLALAGGWLTDRIGEERTLIMTFVGSVCAILVMAFAHGTVLTVALFAQAAFPPLMFPAIFKLFAGAFAAKERSLVLSMTMPPVSLLAAGATPAMISFCGDLGSFGIGFLILGGMIIACLPVIPHFARNTPQLDS